MANLCYFYLHQVYDLTKFADEHPGGTEVLVEAGGKDATVVCIVRSSLPLLQVATPFIQRERESVCVCVCVL
jgi:hypothetical protein